MMNLQEHIGQYLFLKQLEQQERYELFVATEKAEEFTKDPTAVPTLEQIEILEVLCTARSDQKHSPEALEQSLKDIWGDDEYAHLQGWQRVQNIDLKDRINSQFQPLYSRVFNQKVSLNMLMKVMRQKNRRFPLPQALRLAEFSLLSATSLVRLKPKTLDAIGDLVHVGFQGKLSINDHSINQIVLGHLDPSPNDNQATSLLRVIQLLTALTCDVHLSNNKLSISAQQLEQALDERFQGPPSLKETLKTIVSDCLTLSEKVHEDIEVVQALELAHSKLIEAIDKHSLDCPDVLIETFLNSVYPFESAQAKQEIQKYRQRALEVFSPTNQRLKLASLDDFLGDDDHTQTTLSVIPKPSQVLAKVEQYDALSTDSDSGSSEDFSVDDEATGLIVHLHKETQEPMISMEASVDEPSDQDERLVIHEVNADQPQTTPKGLLSDSQASSQVDTQVADAAKEVKLDSKEEKKVEKKVEKNIEKKVESVTTQPTTGQPNERGLLPPRPSDIHSIEAQVRRERGRQLNTIDLIATHDDFDSIDITGAQANELRAIIEEESKAEQPNSRVSSTTVNPVGFAGSFKYPENYISQPHHDSAQVESHTNQEYISEVEHVQNVSEQVVGNGSSETSQATNHAHQDRSFYEPIAPSHKSSKSSPLLLAALLAIVTAVLSNYLAAYLTGPKPTQEQTTVQEKKSESKKQKTVQQVENNGTIATAQEETTGISNQPIDQIVQLKSLNVEPSLIWLPEKFKTLTQLEALKSLNLADDEMIVLWAKNYLPLHVTWSDLKVTAKKKLTELKQDAQVQQKNAKAESSHSQDLITLMPGSVPYLDFKLKVGPNPKKVSLLLNGEIQDQSSALKLPMAITNIIKVQRSGFQDHLIYLEAHPNALKKQSIFLKSTKRAKPEITLRSSVGSAKLTQVDLGDKKAKVKELGQGLGRTKYEKNQSFSFKAEHPGMKSAMWYFKASDSERTNAYTIRLDPMKKGYGELKFSSGYGLEMTLIKLHESRSTQSESISTKLKDKYRLPQSLELEAGEYSVNIYDPKAQVSYRFTSTVYAKQSSQWKLKKERFKDKAKGYTWKTDFVRFKAYRPSKKK